jgi:hypothetical protein
MILNRQLVRLASSFTVWLSGQYLGLINEGRQIELPSCGARRCSAEWRLSMAIGIFLAIS